MTDNPHRDAIFAMDGPLGRLQQQLTIIRCATLGAAADEIDDPDNYALQAIGDQCLTALALLTEVVGHWERAHAAQKGGAA